MISSMSVARVPDRAGFDELFERHAGELRVHCYRMLGSFDDAEDLVQEVFLRAWRKRAEFGSDGRFEVRAWLYRIATNASLDVLRSRSRRVMPPDVAAPTVEFGNGPAPPVDLPWLQPFPDRLLEPAADPAAVVIGRETIELAFIAAIQHLPPRQRAALILRDVGGWSAKETAALLDVSVAAANSALQRARATLREHLGERRSQWPSSVQPNAAERDLLRRYLEAHEQRDVEALAAIVRADVRLTMPPYPTWFDTREPILVGSRIAFDPGFGHFRGLVTGANLQPAVGWYLLAPGGSEYRPHALDVLVVVDGLVAEITSFINPELFERFGLPATL